MPDSSLWMRLWLLTEEPVAADALISYQKQVKCLNRRYFRRNTLRKCPNHRELWDQPRVHMGATPGCHRTNTVGAGGKQPTQPRVERVG